MFNITNYFEHPTRPGHTVFRFYEKERADLFSSFLKESNIWFETEENKEGEKVTYFFGIKNNDLKIASHKNYLVSAKYRKPFIPNAYFRWLVFAIALVVSFLAIMGYMHSR